MTVTVAETAGATRVVALAGEVDVANAEDVRAALVAGGGRELVIDLTRLDFIDASGLSAIVAARQEVVAGGRACTIGGASPRISRTFRIAGLGDLLE